MAGAEQVRRWRPGRRLHWASLLSPHRRGPGDPTHRRLGQGQDVVWWRATRNPDGSVLLRLAPSGDEVVAHAWGDGAVRALGQLPRLLGADDDPDGFEPQHPLLVEAQRRLPDLRIGATDAVGEALFPACLEQVVTGQEAYAAFRALTQKYGEPAPGPAADAESPAYRMMLPPSAEAWARIPTWDYLRAGVEERRSRPLVAAARRGGALERTLQRESADVDHALQSLPGIGPWTSAETRQRAHGDADAWSIGDYHIGGMITHALTGEKQEDDVALELLAPYVGHRYRVQLLISATVGLPPRRGPRRALPTHTPRGTRGRS
ncbi:DNA-3-methyladenine glycosylase family protein [Propionibacteriaceae bacterium Y1700]|uniref:DNA-3-methyladenine glycosylase family protein n=1 Tax=Microlunatus sp. Y1700 TaxID=3418487 RepID=UPI003DA733FE